MMVSLHNPSGGLHYEMNMNKNSIELTNQVEIYARVVRRGRTFVEEYLRSTASAVQWPLESTVTVVIEHVFIF